MANRTEFAFDGNSANRKIVEIVSGSTSNTKQFVTAAGAKLEERDGSSALTKIFQKYGEKISSTNYYYAKDRLGSVREMTDSAGGMQAQYSYDPYGRVTKLAENQVSDFQYGAYYLHDRSSLNLTYFRQYNSNFGRWLSRDPIDEPHLAYEPSILADPTFAPLAYFANLYSYTNNHPTNSTDPYGLFDDGSGGYKKSCMEMCIGAVLLGLALCISGAMLSGPYAVGGVIGCFIIAACLAYACKKFCDSEPWKHGRCPNNQCSV
ncbi:MAG: hypothetical protein K2Y39_21945 [Candidatus Obscuribacterales bacterium]|nr:hypothetical protein [Candidatus Obscuribacterales bacterium]